MNQNKQITFHFPSLKKRRVEAAFKGGDVSSDGGVFSLLRQRIYAMCLGYEDLNDHDSLRKDVGLQTSVDRVGALASSPTLCRWENRADRWIAWLVHEVFVEQFIDSFQEAPKELILDFDSTDDRVHGNQEKRFFHGYYGNYCARGEMENRIEEQQLGLFADRTSCQKWWANQFRLLISSCAYVLMETLRRIGLKAADLARAQVSTIRLKLLKIGVIILQNSRRIRFLLPSSYPHQKFNFENS